MARPGSARTSRWRTCGRPPARCGSPTGPTRCTSVPWRAGSYGATPMAATRPRLAPEKRRTNDMAQDAQRVAIVTGAARGIGAATARRLAGDGMAVAVLDLDAAACTDTVDAITGSGGHAMAVGADVSKADQVEAAVGKVAAELGPPAVLINNAGIIRDNLLFKMTEDDWDMVLGVHLRGAFLMSRAAQKYMVEQRYGRIVNLSSSSALGNRGQVNYSAAKAGMQGFTKTLAIELGQFGVTANAVAPGFIAT